MWTHFSQVEIQGAKLEHPWDSKVMTTRLSNPRHFSFLFHLKTCLDSIKNTYICCRKVRRRNQRGQSTKTTYKQVWECWGQKPARNTRWLYRRGNITESSNFAARRGQIFKYGDWILSITYIFSIYNNHIFLGAAFISWRKFNWSGVNLCELIQLLKWSFTKKRASKHDVFIEFWCKQAANIPLTLCGSDRSSATDAFWVD